MEFRLWVIVQQINRVPFICVNENEMPPFLFIQAFLVWGGFKDYKDFIL